jgi:hypothetical protein
MFIFFIYYFDIYQIRNIQDNFVFIVSKYNLVVSNFWDNSDNLHIIIYI